MNYLVIPAYNPDINLLLLAEAFADHPELQLIIVNDGSRTESYDMFRMVADFAIILSHEKNRGKGCALKTALHYIQTQGDTPSIIVTADADGQHTVSDILSVYRNACKNPDKLVLGVRQFHSGTPLRSLFGNKLTSLIFHLASGQKLSDTQTGLRGFSSDRIPQLLAIKGDRYEYEMNILLQLARKQIPFKEVPIQTVYLNENRSSHFRVFKDSARIYGLILRFLASSLICFGVDFSAFAFFNFYLSLNQTYAAISPVISNIIARMISSMLNFTLNRNMVFRQGQPKKCLKTALLNYYLLAVGILILNTGMLQVFVSCLQMPTLPAKLLTECVLFFISFLIQKRVVFR